MAEAAGVGPATVARFELGETVADETLAKLEKALFDAGAQFSGGAGRVGVTVPE